MIKFVIAACLFSSCLLTSFLEANQNEFEYEILTEVKDDSIQNVFDDIQAQLRQQYPISIFLVQAEEEVNTILFGFCADHLLILNKEKCFLI